MHLITNMMNPSSILKEIMHGDAQQRKDAINRLKETKNKELIEKLVYYVRYEKDPKIRANSILAIGELKDENYLNDIMNASEDAHPIVRHAVASALGIICSEKSIPVLKRLVLDEDIDVSRCAENSLNKIMLTYAYSEELEYEDEDSEVEVRFNDEINDELSNEVKEKEEEVKIASSEINNEIDDYEVIRTLFSSIQSACLNVIRKDGKFDIAKLQDATAKIGRSLNYKPVRNFEFERCKGRKGKVDLAWLDESDFPVVGIEFCEELSPSRLVKLTDLSPAYGFLITPMLQNVDFLKFANTVSLSRKEEIEKGNYYIHMLDYILNSVVGRGDNVVFVDLRKVLKGERYLFGLDEQKKIVPAGTALFPFEKMRGGQDKFISDVVETVNSGRHLVAHAPTGLGKTVSSLTPTVEFALKNGKVVFFLTSKQSQHKIVIDTLKSMQKKAKEKGMNIVAIDIISKQSMCPRPEANSFGILFSEFCKLQQKNKSCKYFSRTNSHVIVDLMKNIFHVDELKRYCIKNGVCPWKTALDAAKNANVIVCDYNYVFSDINEIIFPKLGKTIEDAILIVDEAHNLPDRIRGEYSGELTPRILEEAARELRKRDKQLYHYLMKISSSLEEYVSRELGDKGTQKRIAKESFLNLVNEVLKESLDPITYETFTTMLFDEGEKVLEELETSYTVQVSRFLDGWRLSDSICLKSVQNQPFPSISYRLLDPSFISREIFSRVSSSVVMSGTLVPTEMYADLLGLDKNRTKLQEYTSPFPKENRLNIIDTEITSAYQARNEEMFKNIGVKISDIISSLPGNLAVFFPSYELLEKTLPYVRSNAMLIREERNMSKSEKEELFETLVSIRKSKKKGILLGVQGGSLSEGIDYSDNLLSGVIVVGMPLSPPTVESEALISYYENKFGLGKGRYYGYINPAMNKVLQACGRIIRSEKDRGVVILMDKRFELPKYAKCFPKDFSAIKTSKPQNECIKFYSNSN